MWKLNSVVVLAASGLSLERFERTEAHMGTAARIVLYAVDKEQADRAFQAAFARIRQLDSALSDYKPDSELNRLCREGWRKPVRVSSDLFRALDAAQALARETGGAFDITAGPVIRLWRDARRKGERPEAGQWDAARALTGYHKLTLVPASRSATLQLPGMHLDLGGIAKGYAADEALLVLRRHGIRRALVAVGGDIVLGDPQKGEAGWRVGIEHSGAPGFSKVLRVANCAVSTSGDAEQFLDSSGVRYSHIVDPRTGIALRNQSAVTVVAPDGITADSLATAISVLGMPRGKALAQSRKGVRIYSPGG